VRNLTEAAPTWPPSTADGGHASTRLPTGRRGTDGGYPRPPRTRPCR
jgi:hypothetical protein